MNSAKRQSVYWLMLTLFIANVSGILLYLHCHGHDCEGHDSQSCPVCQVLTDAGHKVVADTPVQLVTCALVLAEVEYAVTSPVMCRIERPDIPRAPPAAV